MSVDYNSVSGYGFELTEEIATKLGKEEDQTVVDWVYDIRGEGGLFEELFPGCEYDVGGDSYQQEETVWVEIVPTVGEELTAGLYEEIKRREDILLETLNKYDIKPKFRFYQDLYIY